MTVAAQAAAQSLSLVAEILAASPALSPAATPVMVASLRAEAARLDLTAEACEAAGDYPSAHALRAQARLYAEGARPELRARRLLIEADEAEATADYFDRSAAEQRGRIGEPAYAHETTRLAAAAEALTAAAIAKRDAAATKRLRARVILRSGRRR